jgi:hypothetical protein
MNQRSHCRTSSICLSTRNHICVHVFCPYCAKTAFGTFSAYFVLCENSLSERVLHTDYENASSLSGPAQMHNESVVYVAPEAAVSDTQRGLKSCGKYGYIE